MSGYDGYSRSNNAARAEIEGKLPLTRAIMFVAQRAKVTRAEAREALLQAGPCEWHHTSKEFNRTNYFDAAATVRRFEDRSKRALFEPFRAEIVKTHAGFSGAAAHGRLAPLYEACAAATGLTVGEVENLYYNIHSSGEE